MLVKSGEFVIVLTIDRGSGADITISIFKDDRVLKESLLDLVRLLDSDFSEKYRQRKPPLNILKSYKIIDFINNYSSSTTVKCETYPVMVLA